MIRLTVLLVSEDHTNDSSCFKVILANTTMWTPVVNETWSGWVTELWNTCRQTTLERGGGRFISWHIYHIYRGRILKAEKDNISPSCPPPICGRFSRCLRFVSLLFASFFLLLPHIKVLWKNAIDWTMSNAHRASIASFPRSAKEKSGGVNKSPDLKAHVQQKHEIGFYS